MTQNFVAMLVWWSQPEWWTAIFAGAVVGVTVITVILASRAYRLESEPVLVCTYAPDSPQHNVSNLNTGGGAVMTYATDTTPWYVISYDDAGEKKVVLRNPRGNEVDPYRRSGTYIEIKNVGRSPAVGITLAVSFKTETLEGQGAEAEMKMLAGRGNILIDVIGPQSSYFVGISNHLGGRALFLPDPWSTQVDWADRKQAETKVPKTKRLRVLSVTFDLPSQLDRKQAQAHE